MFVAAVKLVGDAKWAMLSFGERRADIRLQVEIMWLSDNSGWNGTMNPAPVEASLRLSDHCVTFQ